MWFDRWQLRPDIMSLENPWPGPWGQVEVDAFLHAISSVVIHRFDMFGWLPTMLPAGGGWSPGGHLVKLRFPPQKKVDWLCSVVACFCSSCSFIFHHFPCWCCFFLFCTSKSRPRTLSSTVMPSRQTLPRPAFAGVFSHERDASTISFLTRLYVCFPFWRDLSQFSTALFKHSNIDKYGTWHRRHSIMTCTVEILIIHDYLITVYEYHMCQI